MRLVHKLAGLRRGVLIGLVIVLVAMEAGLLGLAWRATLPAATLGGAPTSNDSPLSQKAKEASPDLSQGTREALRLPQTPDAQPVIRQASASMAQGDYAAVAALFDVEQALTFVEELAAPQFAGREAGSPGGRAAADYVADKFAEFGLQPAGTAGFFQPFPVPYAELTGIPTLSIIDDTGARHADLRFRRDFGLAWGGYAGGGGAGSGGGADSGSAGSGGDDGRVFWVSDGSRDAYLGLDVTGQIVLCKPTDLGEAERQAVEHKAGALLALTDNPANITTRRTYREAPYLPESLPTLYISSTVADALLAGSGYTLSDLSLLYQSVELPSRAQVAVPLYEPGLAEARNVLGVLPGADPALRDRVLILGAHYDHVGLDPNGDLYAGANDNASGVAALLEIARVWQAAGVVPDCTVLFAAWDAEELGLFGSKYYIANPRYPLGATLGMVQLDMVGLASDGVLSVDGAGNAVGRQLVASAQMLGVKTEASELPGGSDHAPFQQAHVPAALLIWDDARVPYYHTPRDTADTLQPERLREVGVITAHAALALTNVIPRLQAVLARQAEAIRAGDGAAYRATLDPADAPLQEAAAIWLSSRPPEARQAFTLTVSSWSVAGDTARADVSAATADENGRSSGLAAYPAQFIRRGNAWRATWPVGGALTTTHLVAQIVAPAEGDGEWLARLGETYGRLAPLLGSQPEGRTALTLYPDRQTLSWLAGVPDAGVHQGQAPLVAPVTAIARTAPLTETAVALILRDLGLPDHQGNWLRTGLTAWAEAAGGADWQAQQTRQWTPLLTDAVSASDVLASVAQGKEQQTAAEAAAWSLTREFMRAYGADGLRRFCAAWGQAGSQTATEAAETSAAAFAALGTTPEAFGQAWERDSLRPLLAARQGVREALAQQQQAVLALDKAAFLATIDPDLQPYRLEQERWFDGLPRQRALTDFRLTGEVLALDGAGEAVARVSLDAGLPDGTRRQPTYLARFRQAGGRWVLAGPDWRAQASQHFVLHYSDASEAVAPPTVGALLAAAEAAYAQVVADLGREPAAPLRINLYSTPAELQASLPWSVPAWRYEEGPAVYWQPGESIKLALPPAVAGGAVAQKVREVVARRVALQILAEERVPDDWLREGVAAFEVLRACPALANSAKSRYLPALSEAQRFHRLYAWQEMPALDALAREEVILFAGQSWLFVEELVQHYGLPALQRLLAERGKGAITGGAIAGGASDGGASLDAAFRAATGLSLAEWQPTWEGAVATGGLPAEWIRAAQTFDPAAAQEIIARLAAPEYAGRAAGSAGGQAAGEWIAQQMAARGLQPAGEGDTFYRPVSAHYAALTDMPALRLRNPATGQELGPLPYLAEFRETLGRSAGPGEVRAEVAWLPNGYQPDMQFGGRVVMKRQQGDALEEADAASQHGVGGLILVQAYLPAPQRELAAAEGITGTLPVVTIAEQTWQEALKLAELSPREANTAPPVLLLGLVADLVVPYDLHYQAEARDVVGLLPGSDPQAAPLIIAAHYDGVGSLPDGTLYPGANQDASGVAVLLEVARVWQRGGQQPARSIYFIAWGAEEPGQASSRRYARDPLVSADRTLALLNLDMVGEARSYYLNVDTATAAENDWQFDFTLAGEQLGRRVSPGKAEGQNASAALRQEAPAILRQGGVPVVQLFWPSASFVHTPQDTPESLDANKLATTGEIVALVSLMMGQR